MSQQVRINEPLGARAAALPLDLGGAGTALALPGVEGIALTIAERGGQWLAEPAPGATLLLNGLALRAAQPLASGDVLGIGGAQVTVHPDQSRIEVVHLAGNATVAPLRPSLLPGDEIQAGVQEIFAARAAGQAAARGGSRAARWIGAGAVAAVLLAGGALLFAVVAVPLQLSPEGASVQSPGLVDWHSGDRVFLLPGRRELTISHPGYRSQSLALDVSRGLADAAPLPVQLEYLPGILEIDTGGIEAEVLVDGSAGGKAPGELSVAAGTHDVIVRAPRHIDHVARIDVKGGGERQQLQVSLQSAIGQLVLDTEPAGAVIRVDDQELGRAPQRLELDAGLHRLVLSAPGRRTWSSEVAIIAGQTLDLGRIDLALPAPAVARAAGVVPESISAGSAPASEVAAAPPPPPRPPPPARAQSELLGTLVLLPAGEYLQGSGRREQGRRSNEVQRTVRLTRAFYMSATEVSNAQFRAFKPTHVSGLAMEKSLDLDPQAVTSVSWNDAVEFCNWLSLREGLPAAYERRAGRWQLVQPLNHGYRLPTEAEWEYAARYVDGQRWQRHAWGDVLPPPPGTTNVAGAEALPQKARSGVPEISALPQYRDEHAVVAPVDSYARSPMGLYGLGGNVSEWMHDVYVSLPDSAAVTDPMGPETEGPHAIRGANWRSAAIAELRSAWRERASGPSNTIGFRVVRFAQELP